MGEDLRERLKIYAEFLDHNVAVERNLIKVWEESNRNPTLHLEAEVRLYAHQKDRDELIKLFPELTSGKADISGKTADLTKMPRPYSIE